MTTITTKIVYDTLNIVEFSLTSTESIDYTKYDIRVCHPDAVLDGSGNQTDASGNRVNKTRVAIATVTKTKQSTLSATPSVFPIPTNATMTSGSIYQATLRLYVNNVWQSLPTVEFYYDTRTFTVEPVHVSSLVVDLAHLEAAAAAAAVDIIDASGNVDVATSNLNAAQTPETIAAAQAALNTANANLNTATNAKYAADAALSSAQLTNHNFVTTAPVVMWDDGMVETPVVLASDDPFFEHFTYDKVTMSCASISTEPNHIPTTHYLGEIPHGQPYVWNVNSLPLNKPYELWGTITHTLKSPSQSGWTSDDSPSNNHKYLVPEIAPNFNIITSDTYGYNLENPTVSSTSLTLGDVSGTISTNAIKFSIDNILSYEVHPFQSITFELKDVSGNVSGNTRFTKTFATRSDNEYIVYATDAAFVAIAAGLVNGEPYNCKITLNFTDDNIYSPSQYRSIVVQGEFNDAIDPIIASSTRVVNSWQLNTSEGEGLIISFKKTDQFLGTNATLPANLDVYGETTVLAVYRVTDAYNNWSDWQNLVGGSIAQGSVNYSLDSNNNNGVYAIPKYTSSAVLGSIQPDVNIYAEIPNQARHPLVQVRLSLVTDNTSFVTDKRTSEIIVIPPQSSYIYPIANASVRYFPNPDAHDFINDVPFITSISVSDVVNFSVPVSIPPYFKSVITTTGSGASFGAASDTNYSGTIYDDDDNVVIYDPDVTGLSYPVSYTGATFQISVKYVYLENHAIETASNSHTIQQQGLSPVTVASVVNSWEEVNSNEGAGLVVSFMKTAQFMGTSSTGYNLDLSVNQATVKAEYSVHDGTAWSEWQTLDGGSIAQGSVNYSLDSNNNNGVYAVPQHTSSVVLGSAQAPVYIYAEIPDQAQYPLVQVRLTLQTNSAAYDPLIAQLNPKQAPIQLSEIKVIDDVDGASYPYNATFRYFLKPVAHNFSNNKPIIDSIDVGDVNFSVPVNVPPFFSSQVTTNDGTGGTASVVVNNDAPNASYDYLSGVVNDLSYAPTDNSSFVLTVKYTSNENPAIYTVPTSMTVQKQGVPSDSFSISSCTWNADTDKIVYTLLINATQFSMNRMDGWNMYTKLTTEPDSDFIPYYNVLKTEGLAQTVDLSGNYPDYSLIDVKFVATRSIYLASDNYENQVETVVGSTKDDESTQIRNLPDTLAPPAASDITLTNIIYNLNSASYNATLSVSLPENVDGLRIVNGPISSTDTSVIIPLPPTPTEFDYTIQYRYDNEVNGVIMELYSDTTTVSFTSGVSNRSAPVIVSKDRVSSAVFNVVYTSSNTGSYSNSVLTSDVYLDRTPDVNVGSDDGSVNLAAYQGSEVSMYVKDTFVSTYTVDGVDTTSTQVINSDPVAVNLASNPTINESSITIETNRLRFTVNNNGTPFIDRMLVVLAQDATINEGDQGTYSLAMFENATGFTDTVVEYANTLSGPGHTLRVIGISGTGMDMTTLFQFNPASSFSSATANVVIHASNAVEGSDSCAIANLESSIL